MASAAPATLSKDRAARARRHMMVTLLDGSFSRGASLLLQALHVHTFEIDRLQDDRLEAGAGHGIRYRLAGIREQDVRAGNSDQRLHLIFRHILDAEDSGLADFNQEHRLFTGLGG